MTERKDWAVELAGKLADVKRPDGWTYGECIEEWAPIIRSTLASVVPGEVEKFCKHLDIVENKLHLAGMDGLELDYQQASTLLRSQAVRIAELEKEIIELHSNMQSNVDILVESQVKSILENFAQDGGPQK